MDRVRIGDDCREDERQTHATPVVGVRVIVALGAAMPAAPTDRRYQQKGQPCSRQQAEQHGAFSPRLSAKSEEEDGRRWKHREPGKANEPESRYEADECPKPEPQAATEMRDPAGRGRSWRRAHQPIVRPGGLWGRCGAPWAATVHVTPAGGRNFFEPLRVLRDMWRLGIPVLAAASCLGTGCGQMAGDCSGGTLSGNTCVNTQVAVTWTDARATAAALAFDNAPMVRGKLTHARCRIITRLPAHEARSLCTGVFVAPNHGSRHVVIAYYLSGTGVVNPDCSIHWKSSPYCAGRGKDRTMTNGG